MKGFQPYTKLFKELLDNGIIKQGEKLNGLKASFKFSKSVCTITFPLKRRNYFNKLVGDVLNEVSKIS